MNKIMIPMERSCHKEYTSHVKYRSPISYIAIVMTNVNVFQIYVKGQGHMIKTFGTNGKVLSRGTLMENMKALPLTVQK